MERSKGFISIALLISTGVCGWWLWQSPAPPPPATQPAAATSPKQPFFWQRFPLMGTHISIQTPFSQRVEAYQIVKHTFQLVDQMMSEWKPHSPLTAVNRAAGKQAIVVPAPLFALLLRCKQIGDMTNGAFDMSWAALWGLWNFKQKPPVLPTKSVIAARRKWVNYRKVQLDPTSRTVRLPHKAMKLGLGGIAKGYALEQSATELKKAGVQDFILSAGGHVYVAGRKHGKLWQIGIRDPRGKQDALVQTLHLTNTSVSTSGDYERFFWHKGKRYHHIIDPRTGYPSRGVRSATVISDDPTLADALSTACMILPPTQCIGLARKQQLQMIIIDAKGLIHNTR